MAAFVEGRERRRHIVRIGCHSASACGELNCACEMSLPRTQLPRIGFEKKSHISIYQLGSFCAVAVLLVYLVRRGPEAQYAESYFPERTGAQAIADSSDRLAALIAVNATDAIFALQEKRRLSCLRDLRYKLIEDFRPFFEKSNGHVVLMDVALHANLGDNILWKAALHLITLHGLSPQLVCYVSQKGFVSNIDKTFPKCNTSEVVNLVKGGGLVLLHAGGNWGDLYRYVHGQRLQYLPELAKAAIEQNFTVVQLPQTVVYKPASEFLGRDDDLMAKLPPGGFVLTTRQRDSQNFALRHYPSIESFMTPDLAYILGPQLPTRDPAYDVLIQMRQDVEVVKTDENQYAWIKEQFAQANMTFNYRDWWYHPEEHTNEISDKVHTTLGDVRMSAAIDLISTGRILITNRLHGSVLGNLMGRYVFLVDTVEGKLGRVHDVRRSVSKECHDDNLHLFQCASLREAVIAAVQLYTVRRNSDNFY